MISPRLSLNELQKIELEEAIAKIKHDFAPEYKPLNIPYEKDKQIQMPDPLNIHDLNFDDEQVTDEIYMCSICLSIPLPNEWSICDGNKCKLILCSHCVLKHRKHHNASQELQCGNSHIFKARPRDSQEHVKRRKFFEKLQFRCMEIGGSTNECGIVMPYYDMVDHMRNHYRKEQYRCHWPECFHRKLYESAEELAELHWKKSCRGFQHIYKLCENCGVQIHDGRHNSINCIENLQNRLSDLKSQLDSEQKLAKDLLNDIAQKEEKTEKEARDTKNNILVLIMSKIEIIKNLTRYYTNKVLAKEDRYAEYRQ